MPSADSQKVLASGEPLAKLLQDATNLNFKVSVPTSYTTVIEAMGANQVDVGWLAPFAYVLAHDKNGAQVLLAWLSTLEGAKAYEAAIGRGNPLIKGTETNERLGTHKMVEYSFAEAATIEKLDAELTQMLMAAEKKR